MAAAVDKALADIEVEVVAAGRTVESAACKNLSPCCSAVAALSSTYRLSHSTAQHFDSAEVVAAVESAAVVVEPAAEMAAYSDQPARIAAVDSVEIVVDAAAAAEDPTADIAVSPVDQYFQS